MAEKQLEILRGYELRLLRCTLAPPPSDLRIQSQPLNEESQCSLLPLHEHINSLIDSIESGHYLQALSSDAAKLVLDTLDFVDLNDSAECADRVYSALLQRVETFIVNDSENDVDKACRVILLMCLSIAALFWFTQCNVTGPSVLNLPKCRFPLEVSTLEGNELIEWENWARYQLMSVGSDLLGKFSYLQYIVFAKMLLIKTKDLLFDATVLPVNGIRTISWWLTRLLLMHQRILDERSSSLYDLLKVFMAETLQHFGTLENVTTYWGNQLHDIDPSEIVSTVHLEAGLLEHIYRRVDSCRKRFESAEVAAGLQLSVTAVLGFRTIHQVEPKAQMVLVANTSSSNTSDACPSISQVIHTHDSTIGDATDVFVTPKLLGNSHESETGVQCVHAGGSAAHLKAIQQAVILSKCLLIEKSSRQDEMQRWDMAPYIEAIDSQQSSCFILKVFCDLLRVRWESTRSRTKGRALEMLDKLVEGISNSSPGVTQRIPFCYVIYVPTIPALRKEFAELLVSCGLIGEAIKIFEDLELWDNLIYCNCLLGKKAAAVELIKARLSEKPNDPRLWCSLGDVTNNDACYEKALEVSNDKSARAKRSLARSAYNRGEYETSKILWEAAMALNSLYPDGWFALGAAALKARDVEKALDGFTRAVQLDPDNGEAWNNIACLHMIKKKSKEAFIAFKEALKFKRNSWQLWENYSHVALDVGNIGQALEAVQTVLNMTNNKRIDTELLERIVLDLEGRTSIIESESCRTTHNLNRTNNTCAKDLPVESVHVSSPEESIMGRSRENEHLMEFLGKILQQVAHVSVIIFFPSFNTELRDILSLSRISKTHVVRSESSADMWGLYARWLKCKGDLTMCSEALLKQVRSYQGSDLWKDRDRFKRFSYASLELCKVYTEISSSSGSRRELFAAEMHLKNVLKQAEGFADMEEFRDLQACLDEVKTKLQSGPVAT
ncbi:tetratricopeptide repeat protein 27 isoform X4 [Citrus clementina]|uniref:tetratricopeptide repeat protein 27 isoform X4 n=1 Tax=Citrus clementina TaxID=85681 RepID=UPI000CED5CED|nr:tetratricopeptide repeat protein 27 isoform X4 [Citrus x clementina]